jgi:hypothetical protein
VVRYSLVLSCPQGCLFIPPSHVHTSVPLPTTYPPDLSGRRKPARKGPWHVHFSLGRSAFSASCWGFLPELDCLRICTYRAVRLCAIEFISEFFCQIAEAWLSSGYSELTLDEMELMSKEIWCDIAYIQIKKIVFLGRKRFVFYGVSVRLRVHVNLQRYAYFDFVSPYV